MMEKIGERPGKYKLEIPVGSDEATRLYCNLIAIRNLTTRYFKNHITTILSDTIEPYVLEALEIAEKYAPADFVKKIKEVEEMVDGIKSKRKRKE